MISSEPADSHPAASPHPASLAHSPAHSSRIGSRQRSCYDRMAIIYQLMLTGQYPNSKTIARQLEVSAKTAQRDIDFIRDRWKMPVAYHPARHGFYFTSPPGSLPGVAITEQEMFALCVAQKALEQYAGTPFYQPLELAFRKFSGQLDNRDRYSLENLDEILSFRPFAPDDAGLRDFGLVTRAITERLALEFRYRKPGTKTADSRRVHPYHVVQFEHRWYLLAHDLDRREIRTFVLGRMQNAVVTSERFVRPRNFNPNKYLNGSLGVMAGSGDYQVVIEMDPWLTDILRGRRWHPTQVVDELPDGSSRLTLRLNSLDEIEQWILSWGTRAHVLGPAALVARLARTAHTLAFRYPLSTEN